MKFGDHNRKNNINKLGTIIFLFYLNNWNDNNKHTRILLWKVRHWPTFMYIVVYAPEIMSVPTIVN